MRRIVLVVLLVMTMPASALAQDCPQTTLADIEDEVMCPVCGTPLGIASDAPQAERERAYIEELIADCRSKDEIKRALVAQFGDAVLALPGDSGGDDDLGDVLVYVIPALAILAAAGGVGLAAVRWRRRERTASAGPAADPSRVDEDMERYDL